MKGFGTSARRGERRLGWALVVSAALHLVVLLPIEWRRPRPPAPPPLTVQLPAPETVRELTTQTEVLDQPLPAPTSGPADRPRELRGRALASAMAALTREEFYPREAIARGWEGRVVLLLTLDEQGRVTDIEVASSSGRDLLDRAAVQAAARIAALPGGRRQALLPVEFRLE